MATGLVCPTPGCATSRWGNRRPVSETDPYRGHNGQVIELIETERLRLEPVTLDDIDLMVELDSDPEVMRYITGGKPTPRDEVIDTVRRSLDHRWIGRDGAGDFAGWFGLRPSAIGEAELGYRLRRPMWGRGYGSEGSQALIEYGFATQGLNRIWAQTMTVNARSRRVMESCGMTYVRTFHIDGLEVIEGSERGDVEYEIVRTEKL